MKRMMNLNGCLTNTAALIQKEGVPVEKWDVLVAGSAQKIMEMGHQLQENQYFGWQIMPNEKDHFTVFASEKLLVETSDYEWIFGTWAEVGEVQREDSKEAFRTRFEKVYALYVKEEETGMVKINRDEASSLYKRLADLGVGIRFAAFGGRKPSCLALLGLHEAIPYSVLGMLCHAFQVVAVKEIGDETTDSEVWLQPVDAAAVMSGLILPHMYAAFQNEDESEEEKKEITDDTPITHLKLSLRATNCLLRYCEVRTVKDLKSITKAELRKVRNIGRKAYQEIIDKAAELGISMEEGGMPDADYSKQLDELIGLDSVKEQVKKVVAFAKLKKDMESMHLKEISMVLNMTFEGNPGTAKTTVARILAGIFAEQGIINNDKILEVGRADLVGKYVGHTADQVKKIFEEARGRLLFIDEAYSLVDDNNRSFGDEAINTIVQEMENHRGETIVIFAGYPKRMEEFLKRNPGLKSRIPFRINFEDYEVEQMVEITELEAKKRGFSLSSEAKEKIRSICREEKGHLDSGNGRLCRNLAENAILNYAVRKYGNGETIVHLDFLLTEEEFVVPERKEEKPAKAVIGFRW